MEEVEESAAAERLKEILGEPGLGVLAVEEDLLRQLPETTLERVERQGIPVILPFAVPARWGEGGAGEEYVAALIRRAIGYHVKIER